ncbi:MAG: DNA-protecting protein DprA [Verrucomicrobiales bacterium]|nr:DNA-protecting protein DprA [Verrucomicrobiales bacterium]
MDNREALVALNMVEQVGPVRLRHLLNHFADPPAVLRASRDALLRVPGIGEETADAIVNWERSVDPGAEFAKAERTGCRILIAEDEEYPPWLREIYDPPIVLYVRGRLENEDRNAIAIVGSRQSTPYGIEAARRLAYQLGHVGVTVVSGGARGIDTAAHQGALAAGGRTICVFGTGIDRVFPAENAGLFDRAAEQGAILTQFPFDRPADKQTFPIRNRIVAGMTLGTVVVEANLASGALITAKFAADYGRQVFAVPGRIDSPRSKGCHELIRQGARLCESAEDVLGEFEYLFPARNRPASPADTGLLPAFALSEREQAVMTALDDGEAHLDAIIRRSHLPASAASATLLGLEMKRLVIQLPGKRFAKNPRIAG